MKADWEIAVEGFFLRIKDFPAEDKQAAIDYIASELKYCTNCHEINCSGWCQDSVRDRD